MRFALLVGLIGCAAVLAGAEETAKAKAISGTFTAAFEGFSQFGQPQVRLKLQLASSLTCPPSAPKLTFSVKGGVDAYFVSAPKESAGYVSTGFASAVTKDGHSEAVLTDFPAGSSLLAEAKSVTCQCGNRTGEGGYINLRTAPLGIPPWVSLMLPAQAGQEDNLFITAKPRGAETVEVHVTGGGLDLKQSYAVADFREKASLMLAIQPTKAEPLQVTATLLPVGASHTFTYPVAAK